MLWPPSLMRFRKVVNGERKRNLWLPLLLVWPLAVALWLVLLPLIVLVAVFTRRSGKGRFVLFGGPRLFRLFCALRRVRVEVDKDNEQLFIALW